MEKEIRYLAAEVRVHQEEEESPKIVGYAARFDRMSEDLGGFREIIKPGAFRSTLNDDVRALWNHDANFVLGRNKSGTLLLEEDDQGLRIEITPPETQWASDLLKSIQRGDVDQMSFGFSIGKDGDRWYEENDTNIRELVTINRLFDVSPVTYPAYPQTSVSVRSKLDELAKDTQASALAEQEAQERTIANKKRKLKLLEV